MKCGACPSHDGTSRYLVVVAAAQLLEDVGRRLGGQGNVQVVHVLQGGQAADGRRQLALQRLAVGADRRNRLGLQAAQLSAAPRAVCHCEYTTASL